MTQENERNIFSGEVAPGRKREIAYLDNLMMVIFDFDDGPMKDVRTDFIKPNR